MESKILGADGNPIKVDAEGKPLEKDEKRELLLEMRRKALREIVSIKNKKRTIVAAGGEWVIGDVLDVGFFAIYAGPTGKLRKRFEDRARAKRRAISNPGNRNARKKRRRKDGKA